MSEDQNEGILRALTLAKLTGQSVNVGLNRAGEPVKVEGIILKVSEDKFRIQLELLDGQPGGPVETIDISEAEYVEYS